MTKGWMPGLCEDGHGYAYGIMIDATKEQKSAEMFEKMNERSRRHYSMTEEERKQDDYNEAWDAALKTREELRALERHGYVRHYAEGESL